MVTEPEGSSYQYYLLHYWNTQ